METFTGKCPIMTQENHQLTMIQMITDP